MDERIVRDGATGKAMIAGTGISIAQLLAELAAAGTVDALLDAHPELTRDDVDAALHFAAGAMDRDSTYRASGVGARRVHEPGLAYGRAGTVVLGVDEYEDLLDRIELMQAIAEADHEIDAGRGIPHDQAMAELLAKYAVRE